VPQDSLERISDDVVSCRKCPRLVAWREHAARHPPARFAGQSYWAKPLPGFGAPNARLLVVGLAPAAHGGNRTGRIFTGDRSGDWLFRALYRAGFANQPTSEHPGDGLRLEDCYIAAVVRSAPPANRPAPSERDNCLPYLVREIAVLRSLRVVVALGSFAWDGALRALKEGGSEVPSPKPRFGHRRPAAIGGYTLIGSYHPSQQNTFTGKLTESDFDAVFADVRKLLQGKIEVDSLKRTS
jgi:uracil-DNA glycosylase family 4